MSDTVLNRDHMRDLSVTVHRHVEVATDVNFVIESQCAVGLLWEPDCFLQGVEELSVVIFLLEEVEVYVHELGCQQQKLVWQEGLERLVKLREVDVGPIPSGEVNIIKRYSVSLDQAPLLFYLFLDNVKVVIQLPAESYLVFS